MPMRYTLQDRNLAEAVKFDFINQGIKIEFQFPPKITSDNRKGEWNEENIPGTEPVATFSKSGPREITLTFTYLVDGGKWTTGAISTHVHNLRGYFSRYRDGDEGFRNLVVAFKMWYHGGEKPISSRIKGVSVKHSETIIVPGGNVNRAYPLRTDVTVDLRLWTKGGPLATQDLPDLVTVEDPNWY